MVVVHLKISNAWKCLKTPRRTSNDRIDTNQLYLPENKTSFKQAVDEYLRSDDTLNWMEVSTKLNELAAEIAGKIGNVRSRPFDAEIERLSSKQKDIRMILMKCNDPEKKRLLKTDRNRIIREIHQKLQDREDKRLDDFADTVNNTPDAAKMFKTTKLLTKHRKRDVFIIKDDGTRITDIENVKRKMCEFYKNMFFDKNETNVPMDTNRPLREPITVSEVRNAIKKL